MDWGRENGPNLLIDEAGDITQFIHEGVRMEEEHERSGRLPDLKSAGNERSRFMMQFIREGIKANPRRFRNIREGLVGVSELTSVGIRRLYQLQENKSLLFPAINISGIVTSQVHKINCYRNLNNPTILFIPRKLYS